MKDFNDIPSVKRLQNIEVCLAVLREKMEKSRIPGEKYTHLCNLEHELCQRRNTTKNDIIQDLNDILL